MILATGTVLAGGKSSRMGTQKAFLKVDGVELIHIIIKELKKIVAEVLVVGGDHGPVKIPGVKIIRDIIPGCGPLGGIHSALVNAKYDRCLFVACDMPFFDSRLGELLIKEVKGYDAAVPVVRGLPEPLFAVYTKRCTSYVENNLLEKRYKIKDFYPQVRVNFLDEGYLRKAVGYRGDIEKFFFNINTRQDLEKAHSLANKKTSQLYKAGPAVISFVGWSGSGKTAVLEKLIPELRKRGLRVAVIKHHGSSRHGNKCCGSRSGIELDAPGKDTWRFMRAGADAVALVERERLVLAARDRQIAALEEVQGGLTLIAQNRDQLTFEKCGRVDCGLALEDVLPLIKNVDLVLAEGFKKSAQPKIEVRRENFAASPPVFSGKRLAVVYNRASRSRGKATTAATYSSEKTAVPCFNADDIEKIAAFILDKICNTGE